MKVLHVITGLNVGGAETMLARLLEQGARAPDLRHEVLTLLRPGPVGRRIAAAGTAVHTIGMTSALPTPASVGRLMRFARVIRPDVVVGWMHHGQLAASLLAACAPGRPPVIWNIRHSIGAWHEEKPLSRLVLRVCAMVSGTPAAITFNAASAIAQYRAIGYRPQRTIVFDNGFDCGMFAPRRTARARIVETFAIPRDRVIVGLVARHHPMKDLPNLVEAVALAAQAGIAVQLLLVGDGMERAGREATARLPDRVTISGYRTDVADWLAGLDILALPSAWGEGFPNIVGEAMAAGVPCVVTDVGDAARVVGDTGRVVPPRSPQALAQALVALALSGTDGRAALGALAQARIGTHFTIEAAADRFAGLVREVGGRRAAAVPATGPVLAGGAA